MAISYLICAAGLGTRMQNISADIPKPLLKLNGHSLLERSVQSLPLKEEDQLVIIHSHDLNQPSLLAGLGQFKTHRNLKFIETPRTRGQLETACAALNTIPQGNSVCVFNSDTFFDCTSFLSAAVKSELDGLIPCSQQPGDSWSFCKVDGKKDSVYLVTEVTEKKRISPWCSVGLYWFKTKDLFRIYAELEMKRVPPNKEVYVAPMYNAMIEAGLSIGMLECEQFKPMGSVDQIEKYWGLSLAEVIEENKI